ncbi:GIY-YIG nuclease family protein, partial [Porticoccaceae bacterium]|nr:GIY-YIG nuclease family protein [Porticoccaceae bacterium]
IDYSKTVIYKIVCNDLNITEVYVGHTTDFVVRKYGHKSSCHNVNRKHYNLKVYKMIRDNGGWDNWTMIEVEKFPCSDGNEAAARERYYFELLNSTLNSNVPGRSVKEWFEQNKEYSKEYGKARYQQDKKFLKEYAKIRYQAKKDQVKEYNKLNKEKIKEYKKNYYKKKKSESIL